MCRAHCANWARRPHRPLRLAEGVLAGDGRGTAPYLSGFPARCIGLARSRPDPSPATVAVEARCPVKTRSAPPSSARESFAQRMTGGGGSPSLPTFLAKQESRSPAGARPGQRDAETGKSPLPRKQKKPAPRTGLAQSPEDREGNHMYRMTRSLMTLGRSAPTTWVCTSRVSWVPLFCLSTRLTLARAWMREPAGTGDGKRRRSEP